MNDVARIEGEVDWNAIAAEHDPDLAEPAPAATTDDDGSIPF
jgi:hypothetical protein